MNLAQANTIRFSRDGEGAGDYAGGRRLCQSVRD
jgi:hypothetical protein